MQVGVYIHLIGLWKIFPISISIKWKKLNQKKSYICPRPSLSFSIVTSGDLAVSLSQIQGVRYATHEHKTCICMTLWVFPGVLSSVLVSQIQGQHLSINNVFELNLSFILPQAPVHSLWDAQKMRLALQSSQRCKKLCLPSLDSFDIQDFQLYFL